MNHCYAWCGDHQDLSHRLVKPKHSLRHAIQSNKFHGIIHYVSSESLRSRTLLTKHQDRHARSLTLYRDHWRQKKMKTKPDKESKKLTVLQTPAVSSVLCSIGMEGILLKREARGPCGLPSGEAFGVTSLVL
jgi:hypothetical protein